MMKKNKTKKIIRSYHSFYTPYKNIRQGQSSDDERVKQLTMPSPNNAPDLEDEIKSQMKVLGKSYCKYSKKCNRNCFGENYDCQIYKFYEKYPNHPQMFIGSRK